MNAKAGHTRVHFACGETFVVVAQSSQIIVSGKDLLFSITHSPLVLERVSYTTLTMDEAFSAESFVRLKGGLLKLLNLRILSSGMLLILYSFRKSNLFEQIGGVVVLLASIQVNDGDNCHLNVDRCHILDTPSEIGVPTNAIFISDEKALLVARWFLFWIVFETLKFTERISLDSLSVVPFNGNMANNDTETSVNISVDSVCVDSSSEPCCLLLHNATSSQPRLFVLSHEDKLVNIAIKTLFNPFLWSKLDSSNTERLNPSLICSILFPTIHADLCTLVIGFKPNCVISLTMEEENGNGQITQIQVYQSLASSPKKIFETDIGFCAIVDGPHYSSLTVISPHNFSPLVEMEGFVDILCYDFLEDGSDAFIMVLPDDLSRARVRILNPDGQCISNRVYSTRDFKEFEINTVKSVSSHGGEYVGGLLSEGLSSVLGEQVNAHSSANSELRTRFCHLKDMYIRLCRVLSETNSNRNDTISSAPLTSSNDEKIVTLEFNDKEGDVSDSYKSENGSNEWGDIRVKDIVSNSSCIVADIESIHSISSSNTTVFLSLVSFLASRDVLSNSVPVVLDTGEVTASLTKVRGGSPVSLLTANICSGDRIREVVPLGVVNLEEQTLSASANVIVEYTLEMEFFGPQSVIEAHIIKLTGESDLRLIDGTVDIEIEGGRLSLQGNVSDGIASLIFHSRNKKAIDELIESSFFSRPVGLVIKPPLSVLRDFLTRLSKRLFDEIASLASSCSDEEKLNFIRGTDEMFHDISYRFVHLFIEKRIRRSKGYE